MNFMKEKGTNYYQQLMDFARNGFIDPFEDLGTFDCRTLKFNEPVEVLKNKFSGCSYTPYWQETIQKMREIYILYQKELRENMVPKKERIGYIRDAELRDSFREKVQLYLSLGFRFSEVAEAVGYTEKTLRNSFRRSEWNQMNDPICYDKEDLRKGKVINRKTAPLDKLRKKSCCLVLTK